MKNHSRTFALNWLAAIALAALLATAHHLDGPADYEAERAQLASLQDAIKTEAAAARLARAAAAMCGANAAYKLLDETTVQCYTRKGKPTQKVSL